MLSQEQISSYEENGFLVIEKLFNQTEVEQALNSIGHVLDTNKNSSEQEPKDNNIVRRIWSPTDKHNYFWQMATAPALLDCIEGLIGPDILFHYSKLNMKGPKVGSIVEWHQDFSYYPHTNTDLLTTLIFLDDANIENGCLKVVPGSHKRGLCDHTINNYFRGKVSDVDEQDAIHLEVPAGGAVFLHCLTLHASDINTSRKYRRTFLPSYRAADAYPLYFGPHASHNEPGVKVVRGEKSQQARVSEGQYAMPISEKEFGSLYEIQEGSFLNKDTTKMKKTGYAVS